MLRIVSFLLLKHVNYKKIYFTIFTW